MALHGSPSSPSVVGIVVSAAKKYNKIVHYEAATERIMECDGQGKPKDSKHHEATGISWDSGSPLLLRKGVQYALEAGADSIGITNLCTPRLAGVLFDSLSEATSPSSKNRHAIKTSQSFAPTAI
eukprot:CAMPEP_0172464636 /NCGR_PEP_ID=MMETSP1065-20121228/51044_1 /TAXON_ID=265537 /ORGANISM="Amphiprora paludosa, Strain CCMP125" /LENGTH=124 /DNA_ID=CAMNT_0013220919 /DNA_START=117 /DNA_END=488 /DNA_ORIENTATION=-